MANEEHLRILKQGVEVWNGWRSRNRDVVPDLYEVDLWRANLHGANLSKADLYRARLGYANLSGACLMQANLAQSHLCCADVSRSNLSRAGLSGAELIDADLTGSDLSEAVLCGANVAGANLQDANLSNANLAVANLFNANLTGANLSSACLEGALLSHADLTRAMLVGCRIHGISAWALKSDDAVQSDLLITYQNEPQVTVDDLEVAQFVYLLLNNRKLRNVIEAVTSKAVLILGRFCPERKVVLDALREELRHRNYTPIVFDFEKPASRDFTETVRTLAGLSRFVIADLTAQRSAPHELMSFVPFCPSVPVQAICHASDAPYAMFPDFRRYPWVLPPHTYNSLEELLADLPERIVAPAEAKVIELRKS